MFRSEIDLPVDVRVPPKAYPIYQINIVNAVVADFVVVDY